MTDKQTVDDFKAELIEWLEGEKYQKAEGTDFFAVRNRCVNSALDAVITKIKEM